MKESAPGLAVIGAGLPRTGTFGMKAILERFGFGPCYHMHEVYSRPDHIVAWRSARNSFPDWNMLFAEFRATMDAPACLFWRDLARAFPDAKIVLTTRKAIDWYDSFTQTVLIPMTNPSMMGDGAQPALEMARELVVDWFLEGRPDDRAHALRAYERHNEEVRAAFDSERLLEYDLAEGWEPLCRFLQVPAHRTAGHAREQLAIDIGKGG